MTNRPASVVEAFVRHAEGTPEKTCLRFEGEQWTYDRLRGRAETFAAALKTWGLKPGERVALFLGNSPDFLAAYLGTHLAGGVMVPVNTQYRRGELRHIFEDAGVRLCLTDGERRPELDGVREELGRLEAVIEAGEELEDFLNAAEPQEPGLPGGDDLAVIAYTSGTTGRSKGAMLLHRNLVANAEAICEAWRWTADDHLLLTLPLFHTHGLTVGAHGTFFAGASAELWRKFDAAAVYDALLEGSLTMFFGVPTMYTRLLREAEAREERPRPLRLYVAGSAALSPQAFERFEELFGERILERYGMTETGMNLTNPYDGERRPGTVGGPFPGQEARVVGIESREPLPAGEVGEIEVRGPHVFAGYWERPDATEEVFEEGGWFRTEDLGSIDEDGYFTISGRTKELIISGGYNVYPREVEEVIEGHPGVAEVAVVGLPDEEFGERVTAAVVRDDEELTAEKVKDFCRDDLAGYKKPREVVFVDELPRNALGKVLKHEVREGLVEREG
ncbi:MAG: Long-chain-fatty-acid--CoA ligase [uncultured Rubrobacteraceae bacterium]|uniref:Long-chain-fatty-acid--CoA ligase n=1 Tax=uncultured Rubrobacteraceae bacterium TaxID=349277 RepID=A0A6J4Q752_9ACTN|nr:MAG: Long-chain-fatty-acid--CoA ligase [uncultured Rubrobacteraceae bacterium]